MNTSLKIVRHLAVTHPTSRPTIQWTLGIKRLARETDFSPLQVSRLRVSRIIHILSHTLSGRSQGQLHIAACLSAWYKGRQTIYSSSKNHRKRNMIYRRSVQYPEYELSEVISCM